MLEIYVHIPFCIKKCAYCDFNSFFGDEAAVNAYKEMLIKEIKACPHRGERVDTVFIGGGTPSFIDAGHIYDIMDTVSKSFSVSDDCEISMEANPESISAEKLAVYKSAGINRVSMGVQSFCDEELKTLGRVHSGEKAVSSYMKIREAGFDNVNLDLMFSFPGQTLESWEKSLRKAAELEPSHISAYSLIIEEGTEFFKKYKNYQTNEILDRIMYRKTSEILSEYGFHRYEISNFSKSGRECRHNIGYWKRYNYIGFGLSAHSLYDDIRSSNTDSFEEYIKGNTAGETEKLSTDDKIGEFMFLGLRMSEGVRYSDFSKTFGIGLYDRFANVIEKYCRMGLLETDDTSLKLTDRGIDVSNTIFAEFI